MNKELRLFERIKHAPTFYVGCASDIYTRFPYECKLIENALKENEYLKTEWLGQRQELNIKTKALEIIRKKEVDVHLFKICPDYEYNNWIRIRDGERQLTIEEYDLLKEILSE